MISVGIDVSKGKSTVCIMKPYGEIIRSPYEVAHSINELQELALLLLHLDEEVKVIMEVTGTYHLPILMYLKEKGIFTSVVNPLIMKKYADSSTIRKGKTDKIDARRIASYGLDNWCHLVEFDAGKKRYQELKLLSRQYSHYMKMRIESVLSLTSLLDSTMPGITKVLPGWKIETEKDKLSDFVEEFWHYDLITEKSEKQFTEKYVKWAKKKGYRNNQAKASEIFAIAKNGIPTVSSQSLTTKLLVNEAVHVLREVDKTLATILSQMQEIAMNLKEYPVVRAMKGVGDRLAPRLIGEIGDITRFKSGSALIAFAGIDAPPYQSGQFYGTNRRISKRGNPGLRKAGYEVMKSLKTNKPIGDSVYCYIIKKENEGKPKKVAKIAGLNKFLRIYYARVKEVYQ
ncbi:MAG TPA: IS110 family transposase [Clostridia bacterium]|nr:IS110 family transposase [Clostridia bacterium]